MLNIIPKVKENIHILEKLLPILSFIIPFLIIYSLDPDSFIVTYPGRTFYVFFLWLVSLEIVVNWEKLQRSTSSNLKSIRNVSSIMLLSFPTIYVLIYTVVANFFGLNAIILVSTILSSASLARLAYLMLSMEYLVFAALFALVILQAYGVNGLMDFSIPVSFLGIIGVIYTVDCLYPYGRFTPFQILVPATATLAANVLHLMGYQTHIYFIDHPDYGSMPTLSVWDSQGRYSDDISIAWPCAGVESLLIYTVTILLFLKKTSIPWKHRIIYLIIGAVVTYIINILRVATIFVISINGGDIWPFHNYYGWLYSISWIVSYPLIIIGSRILWRKIRNWKAVQDVLEPSNL
jgi:exosortase/archaeosortase family protein